MSEFDDGQPELGETLTVQDYNERYPERIVYDDQLWVNDLYLLWLLHLPAKERQTPSRASQWIIQLAVKGEVSEVGEREITLNLTDEDVNEVMARYKGTIDHGLITFTPPLTFPAGGDDQAEAVEHGFLTHYYNDGGGEWFDLPEPIEPDGVSITRELVSVP